MTDYGRKIAEQDRLLNEYSRKLIQLEQKISNSEPPVATSETPPPSGRKRKAKGKHFNWFFLHIESSFFFLIWKTQRKMKKMMKRNRLAIREISNVKWLRRRWKIATNRKSPFPCRCVTARAVNNWSRSYTKKKKIKLQFNGNTSHLNSWIVLLTIYKVKIKFVFWLSYLNCGPIFLFVFFFQIVRRPSV